MNRKRKGICLWSSVLINPGCRLWSCNQHYSSHSPMTCSTYNTQDLLISKPLGKFGRKPTFSYLTLHIIFHRDGLDYRCAICRKRHPPNWILTAHYRNNPYYAHAERGRGLRSSKKDWLKKLGEEVRCQTMNTEFEIMSLPPSSARLHSENGRK
jgi:hypothetical protein